jgi:hypothetical protein
VQSLLTFGRLSQILQSRYGCDRMMLSPVGDMEDSDGTPTPALYAFVRVVNGQQVEAIVHVYEETLPVMDDMLRHVCDRLLTDEADFSAPI